MKNIKKIGGIFFSICLFFMLLTGDVFAASAKVSVSSVSGNVGSTVTVTCSATTSGTAIGGADITLKYDPAALTVVSCSSGASGNSGSVYYSGYATSGGLSKLSFTVSFKIAKAGAHSISVSSADVYDYEAAGSISTSSSGGTVTGKVPTNNNNTNNNTNNNNSQQNNKDKNNKLSALQVYPGTLTPAFSSDTTAYTVAVPGNTTEVTISATPASSKATVSVSGGKDLKLGANEAKVIVVAESGASRAYTITIMCGEAEKIQIDGTEHTINENFADEQIPTGFSRKQVTYNDRQYEAVTNASGSMTLMSLQSGENAYFYIYNQETQEFYNFQQITFSEGKYIIPLPLNDTVLEFAEYEKVTLQVGGKSVEAWKLDEEFSVVYVMNQEDKEVLYKYDSVDGTFQRYNDIKVEDVEQTPVQKTWFPNAYYMYAIVGLGILSLILLITMIYFIASRKIRHEGRKKKAIRRQEKQREKEERWREKEEYKREKEERERQEHQRILEEEREKQRQIEEKKMAKQKAKEEKKLAKQNKREE